MHRLLQTWFRRLFTRTHTAGPFATLGAPLTYAFLTILAVALLAMALHRFNPDPGIAGVLPNRTADVTDPHARIERFQTFVHTDLYGDVQFAEKGANHPVKEALEDQGREHFVDNPFLNGFSLAWLRAYDVTVSPKPVLGISLPNLYGSYWLDIARSFKQRLEIAGVPYYLRFADGSEKNQREQLKELMDKHVTALIVAPIDTSDLSEVLDEARAKGIRIISLEGLVQKTNTLSAHIGYDAYTIGALQATMLLEGLKAHHPKSIPWRVEVFPGRSHDNRALVQYQAAMDVLAPYIEEGYIVIPSGERSFQRLFTLEDVAQNIGRRMGKLARTTTPTPNGLLVDGIIAPSDRFARMAIAMSQMQAISKTSPTTPDVTQFSPHQLLELAYSITLPYVQDPANPHAFHYFAYDTSPGATPLLLDALFAKDEHDSLTIHQLPIVVGRDAEQLSVASMMALQQYSSVYKDPNTMVAAALDMAAGLDTHALPRATDWSVQKIYNRSMMVTCYLGQPVPLRLSDVPLTFLNNPEAGSVVNMMHSRQQMWNDHALWKGAARSLRIQ